MAQEAQLLETGSIFLIGDKKYVYEHTYRGADGELIIALSDPTKNSPNNILIQKFIPVSE